MKSILALLLRIANGMEQVGAIPLSLAHKAARFISKTANFLKTLLFRKSVLYGVLTAVLVFLSFQAGQHAGTIEHQKKVAEIRAQSPVKILDRNGTLLFISTVGRYESTSPTSEDYKRAPEFVEFALQKLRKQFGETVLDNGVIVQTTLDLPLQIEAQQTVIETVMGYETDDGTMIIVDSKNGDIIAFVESMHYFDQQYKRETKIDYSSLNPFLSITDANGKHIYGRDSEKKPIDNEELVSNALWIPNSTSTVTFNEYIISTWIGNN
ncbi:MAG: hypothetical protein ABIO02_04755 [Patescibacteria group bacterium]